MKALGAGLCLGLVILSAQAAERWDFKGRISVSGPPVDGVYHHLDGAGRKHIAVSNGSIALTWEDNRSAAPQVYVAVKPATAAGFEAALAVSTGSEAYEPAIAAIPDHRFVLVFEQDAAVYARVLTPDGLGDPTRLSQGRASHVSVASSATQVFASWRQRENGRWSVQVAQLRVTGANRIVIESRQPVEANGLQTPVLFPTIALNEAGLCIAWEDRRAGHTRLLVSYADQAGLVFSEPRSLNEHLSNRNQYDQGNGVTRVSLASFGRDEILAAWMDKRRGGAGYGIFAALGAEAGAIFGPNEKVHGEEGDRQPHYNPATAGNPQGDFVVAWDDFRRGDSDIWISVYNDDLEWSEEHAPGIASGNGEQSHPSIAFDAQQNLHLLWIERSEMNAASQLWYSSGRIKRP